MNKLKIERGASKVRWVLLKTTIEQTIATDVDLMCKWSDNDRKYIVNELLRFALAQSRDFQEYKAELTGADYAGEGDQAQDVVRSHSIDSKTARTAIRDSGEPGQPA